MKIDALTLAYGNKVILDNININVPNGEFIFFIGKSGCGKTSLISCLIGDFKPLSGNIILDNGAVLYGQKADFVLAYRRKIGVVFQDYKLIESKTIYENVAFAMEVCGYKDSYILSRVPNVLQMVELLSKSEKKISELSGGEKQRLAIARALAHDPDIIMGDEPTGNLDPQTAKEIMKIFDELNKVGKTIIIATHDLNIVNEMKKRVVTFKEKKVFSDVKKGVYNI